MTANLALIVFLLVANGFFVAAEFALVKCRQFRLQTLIDEGRFGASLAERMRQNVEPFLAACQLGITMASLGLGWVGEPFVAAILKPLFSVLDFSEQAVHTISFVTGFIVFSSLHIVVGEQVPKTWAIRMAEPMARYCAHTLYAFYWLAYPLTWVLNRATAGMLALFRVEQASHGDVLSDRELQGAIATSTAHGQLEENKASMLANLFAFDERTVGRVMIPRSEVVVLNTEAPDEVNLRALTAHGHSRFPLMHGGTHAPIGIVLAKRLFHIMLERGAIPWSELAAMATPPLVIPESSKISELFEFMRRERAHMAVVVDEYGDFSGLVTLEDLLEEIVGEISDEFDAETERYAVTPTSAGWETHGLTPLTDVEKHVGLVVPDSLNANTLSGLLMQRLGKIPAPGDHILEEGFRIQVLTAEDHHVTQVAITPPPIVVDDSAPSTKDSS